MALTEIPIELSSTPSIVDGGNATAITIDSSENVTFSGTLNGISTTKSASGNRWGILPEVESNGVMEVGRYLDFHSTDGDTSDYGARLDYNGTDIVSTNAFVMSSGIYLGGTAAANKLEDYEEGTWTPTIFGGTDAGTYSLESARTGGVYTKIGNVVYISAVLRISSISSAGTGSLNFGGLPFVMGANIASAWSEGSNIQITHYGAGTNSSASTYPPPFIATGGLGSSNINAASYGKNYRVSTVIGDLSAANWIYIITGFYSTSE